MSIEKNQLRRLIRSVLKALAVGSGIEHMHMDGAVELLMLTAAQESHCGMWIEQVQGPALGIFQMEPRTLMDIFDNFLKYKPALHATVKGFIAPNMPYDMNMRGNILFQIAMVRVHYFRAGCKIPRVDDVQGLAECYKKHYNTVQGKATVEEAIKNYKMYAI